jgi:hypothetical protein
MVFIRSKSLRRSRHDVDDAPSVVANGKSHDATLMACSTTPPVFRSVDILILPDIQQPPSTVMVAEVRSLATGLTNHSSSTVPIRNAASANPMMMDRVGSTTIATTSTMSKAEAINSVAANQHPRRTRVEAASSNLVIPSTPIRHSSLRVLWSRRASQAHATVLVVDPPNNNVTTGEEEMCGCCGDVAFVFLLATVGLCIGIGVMLTKDPGLWMSLPPTMAPSLSPTDPRRPFLPHRSKGSARPTLSKTM